MAAAMTIHERPSETIPVQPDLAAALLDRPLEFIHADHLRHRAICAAMRRFAEQGMASRADADRIVAYLAHDRRLHHEDEDLDLFPALRRRAQVADDLGALLTGLSEDHRHADPMSQAIVDALAAHPDEDPIHIGSQTAELFQDYAAREHRHLAIENGVVLAIARIRLTRADLKTVSHNMKIRRGIVAP